MSYLTDLEKSKIKFFVGYVLYIPDEYLVKDFDAFQYSKIQDAIAQCETNYNLIGSTNLIADKVESVVIDTASNNYALQTHTANYSRSARLSYGQSLTRYYNSIDRLITALGYLL